MINVDREMEYGNIQITETEQLPKPKKKSQYDELDSPLDPPKEIYIFPADKREGIKFVANYQLSESAYDVDIDSIEEVEWDEKTNADMVAKDQMGGTTGSEIIVVPNEEFEMIVDSIIRQIPSGMVIVSIGNLKEADLYNNNLDNKYKHKIQQLTDLKNELLLNKIEQDKLYDIKNTNIRKS